MTKIKKGDILRSRKDGYFELFDKRGYQLDCTAIDRGEVFVFLNRRHRNENKVYDAGNWENDYDLLNSHGEIIVMPWCDREFAEFFEVVN